jgi:CO/xanthine dehydrogenase FAD-binding subunit
LDFPDKQVNFIKNVRIAMTITEYVKPGDLSDLRQVMAEYKARATVIAGGTNLIPEMRNGEESPELLIDISDMTELSFIRENNGSIAIGAATTIAEVAASPVLLDNSPILASAAKQLGNPLTRNRATLGGNLANASPCADTAPPLLALDAAVEILSSGGKTRQVPLSKFFRGYKFTDLVKGEVLTGITFPKPNDSTKGSHTKIGLRNAASICVASIAVMLDMDGKTCRKARVAAGSVAPIPMRAYRVEKFLEGKEINATLLEECMAVVKEEISPISDIRGSLEYRSYVTSMILKRNIKRALK